MPATSQPLKGTLRGLSLGCTETSEFKRKVAALERELKQQQESTQAVGEEPSHVPRAPWCSTSALHLCPLGSWGKGEGNSRGRWA